MQYLFRSLHTSRQLAASCISRPISKCFGGRSEQWCSQYTGDHRLSSLVPLTYVSSLELATESSHLRGIHEALEAKGIIQLQLEFPDTKSSYLQQLILNLHKEYKHGLPITHSAERGWFWDVRPNPSSFQSHGHQARSETMHRFDWHTDCSYEKCPPRYFALQVLQPDRCGGGTLSVLNVDRLLTLLSPFARKWLSTPNYQINVPPEFLKDAGEKYIRGNLLAVKGDGGRNGSQLRLREDITIPLTEDAKKALEELEGILFSEAAGAETLHLKPESLPEGSIIMMDNRRWLHSRSEVKDPNRHLRRVRWGATKFGDASF